MVLARKKFQISMSRKTPDGSLISVTFGTDLEEDTSDPEGLAVRVVHETYQDILTACKTDKFTRSVVGSINTALKREARVEEALREIGNEE